MRRILCFFGVCFLVPASDWLGFRGPNGSGIADATNLPTQFDLNHHLLWKREIPEGKSQPVLAGKLIFITGHDGGKLLTLALFRDSGKISWHREINQTRKEKLHQLNHPAVATPVSDGLNVYAFFGDFGLISYGADGNERWKLPLGPFTNFHGMAASPVLDGDRIFLLCDQDERSFLMAADKATGKLLWRVDRPDVVHGFATPTIFRPKDAPPQIIVPGSYRIDSYDLATGKQVWFVRGLTWQVKPSAVVSNDMVFATGWAPGADAGQRAQLPPFQEVLKEADADGDGKLSQSEVPPKWKHSGSWDAIDLNHDGYLDGREWDFYKSRRAAENWTIAIKPAGRTGDLTDSAVLWKYDRSVPVVSSPLLLNGLLYTIKDGGIFTALDASTGLVTKQARLKDAIDSYYASPIAADGKIFLASENGKVSVIKPGRDWEVLATNNLNESIYASPVVENGRLYIRTSGGLYCFSGAMNNP